MGRLLCIDYGKKRVGLAMTDELQIISSPFDVYQNDDSLIPRLVALCEKYKVEKIILGLPYSNTTDEAELMVRKFASRLTKVIDIPIDYQDEQYTSADATEIMRITGYKKKDYKKNLNKYAAQKILEAYLGK